MAAIEAYESAKGAKQRMTALTDVLVLCALTLLPPGETTVCRTPPVGRHHNSTSPLSPPSVDRVGVIRLLKHGYTLKWEPDEAGGDQDDGGYYIDLTDRSARHKVGRVCKCTRQWPPPARDLFTLTVPRPVPL